MDKHTHLVELKSLMSELDLVPMGGQDTSVSLRQLTGRTIAETLNDYGYNCFPGEGYVNVETEEGMIYVSYDRLPIVTITSVFRLRETEEGLKNIRKALNEIIRDWDMVKGYVDEDEELLLLFFDARHPDVESFRENIRYYIELIMDASKAYKEKYYEYKRDRALNMFGKPSHKSILS